MMLYMLDMLNMYFKARGTIFCHGKALKIFDYIYRLMFLGQTFGRNFDKHMMFFTTLGDVLGHVLEMFWTCFGMVLVWFWGLVGGIFPHSYPHRGVYLYISE